MCKNIIDYNTIIEFFYNVKDDKYKEFHKSLVNNSKYKIMGVRLPIIRKKAKELIKENYLKTIYEFPNEYYEMVMLKGLLVASIDNENDFDKYFIKYIKLIDNWALCDTFCNSIKIIKRNPRKYFEIAVNLCKTENEYSIRVGLVLMLSHFVKKEYLEEIYNILNYIDSQSYYVNMAMSWLGCELYIKYPEETLEFIKNNKFNKFTQNKMISKINDSYRVDKKTKEYLKQFRK